VPVGGRGLHDRRLRNAGRIPLLDHGLVRGRPVARPRALRAAERRQRQARGVGTDDVRMDVDDRGHGAFRARDGAPGSGLTAPPPLRNPARAIACPNHFFGMPAFSITSAHLAMSTLMRALSSSEVEPRASMPNFAIAARTSGCATAAVTSRESRSTISCGVFFGAASPFQLVTS